MAPKRKLPSGRTSSRMDSGQATPQSLESDSDYQTSSVGDVSGNEGGTGTSKPRNKKLKTNEKEKDPWSLNTYRRKYLKANPGLRPSHKSQSFKSDFSRFPLKPDHDTRPIWLDPERGNLIVESFCPIANEARDFLITMSEPVSRPSHVHEYRISDQSLLSASASGLEPDELIQALEVFSKAVIPEYFKDWVLDVTKSFGKIKLVLKHTKYFIESPDPSALQKLLKDSVIGPCRIEGTEESRAEKSAGMDGLVIPGTNNATGQKAAEEQKQQQAQQAQRVEGNLDGDSDSDADDNMEGGLNDEDFTALLRDEEDEDDENTSRVHSFQIAPKDVETVKSRCIDIRLPISEEYDFRNDTRNANLDIDLRPSARIRDYQETSLAKMFGNGRAKSGIIVLPCGAGKTLVGITAACTVKKGIVILCTSSMSVVQWKSEFLKWSNINPADIAVFTAEHKDKFSGSTGIIISTYSMVTQSQHRSYDTQKMMDFLTGREWGLMILDEVHVVPANIFRKATAEIKTHSKLGLTATLLREDDKITDLNFLIGPKLYEANWMELASQGHIARVQCAEVWCPMTAEFYSEYLAATARKRMLLYTMNPRKFQAAQFLIDYHERRGDKIIVFSDNVYTLQRYAKKLGKFYIFGGTPQNERLRILENFQHNENVNTVFLSKIGDTSLDLPEATCLIQISSHYGSRRQEAQRLGRILRAKRRNDEGFNAFFYSLVSKDTTEMYYSTKRQAFLVDQGYSFKTITHLHGMETMKDLAFRNAHERRELLQDVMLQNEMSNDVENIDGDLFSGRSQVRAGRGAKGGAGGGAGGGSGGAHGANAVQGAKRMAGMLSDLSGGQDMAYMEYNKGRNAEMKGRGGGGAGAGRGGGNKKGQQGPQNAFIRKLQRENVRKRQANK
ncbi:MAG: hypothetical protein M1831_001240 [Alyxoria varia]|nr:MAG: hypothetical protein M1831_001240 [Alyxoria varia]